MSTVILLGDCMAKLREIPDASVQCVVTSPPYWGLRDYKIPPTVWGGALECDHSWGEDMRMHKGGPHGNGVMLAGGRSVIEAQASTKDINAGNFCRYCEAWRGNLGLEPTPKLFVEHMVAVFDEVWRVLRKDGTLWLNLGDSYATGAGAVGKRPGGGGQGDAWAGGAGPMTQPNRMPIEGLKPKDLVGIPWRVAFALQDAGWWLRQEIIWHKPNPMPESVRDRCTKAHEHLFLLAKAEKYYFDADAIAEPASPNTHARLAQNTDAQAGSTRGLDGGHSHKPMKAVVKTAYRGVNGWAVGPGDHSVVDHNQEGVVSHGEAKRQAKLGEKGEAMPDDVRGSASARFGRGAGWRRKLAEANSGTKNNTSMDEALAVMPLTRNKRSVWHIPEEEYQQFLAWKAAQQPQAPDVWTIGSEAFKEAHFATFPPALVEPCILSGSRPGDTVLDPFGGAGTVGLVAERLQRSAILIELNPEYAAMARRRISADAPLLAEVAEA